jgi:hypothetical protein
LVSPRRRQLDGEVIPAVRRRVASDGVGSDEGGDDGTADDSTAKLVDGDAERLGGGDENRRM